MRREQISLLHRLIHGVLFFSILLAIQLSPPGRAAGEDDWVSVPVYGTVLFRRQIDWQTENAEEVVRISVRSHSHAIYRFNGGTKIEQEGETVYLPSGTVSGQISDRSSTISWLEDGDTVELFHDSHGIFNGQIEAENPAIEINPKLGKFRLSLPTAEATGRTVGVMYANGEEMFRDENDQDLFRLLQNEIPDSLQEGVLRNGRYDTKKGLISGSFARTVYTGYAPGPLDFSANLASGDPVAGKLDPFKMPVRLSLQWNLHLKKPQAKLELEVDGDYQSWLPDADQKTPLKVTARIVEPKNAKGKIRFRFSEVSKEPGQCLNWPPRAENDTTPDLFLEADPSARAAVKLGDDWQTAESVDEVAEITILVRPEDFGAYGKLEAEADIYTAAGLETVRASYKYPGGELPYLPLPWDEDDNHVADTWEKETESGNFPGADDDLTPGSSLFKGDGLTVYEEYRGFRVRSKHRRTDPQVKDLFLYDPDDLLPLSHYGRGAFGGLLIHTVFPSEMNYSGTGGGSRFREVNTNHGSEYHETDQHGLVIQADNSTTSGFGYAFDSVFSTPGKVGPPCETERIEVYGVRIAQFVRGYIENHRDQLEADMAPDKPDKAWTEKITGGLAAFAITHELGHGIGLAHHDPDYAAPYSCPMCRPRDEYDDGFTVYGIMRGLHQWPYAYCERCLRRMMVSDKYRGWG